MNDLFYCFEDDTNGEDDDENVELDDEELGDELNEEVNMQESSTKPKTGE